MMAGNFGFIHEKIEIKILILFILRRFPDPITFDVLTELAMCDDGIGYFDYSQCVAELTKTEHLKVDGDEYSLTAKGIRNGEATENSLPFSVRMKAEKKISEIRAVQNRSAMILTSHEAAPNNGCIVNLAMSDGIGDILTVKLLAADARQAMSLEKGFRRKAEKVYNALIEMLLD